VCVCIGGGGKRRTKRPVSMWLWLCGQQCHCLPSFRSQQLQL